MFHSPPSTIERYLRGTWTKCLICLKGILRFLLTRIVSKEEWFMWEIEFGNYADRTVRSLFYGGSIIYIEDGFFSQKKKKRSKTVNSLYDCLNFSALDILQEKNKKNRFVDEHKISSQFDENAYQRSNSSIRGISSFISHSFYCKWQQ